MKKICCAMLAVAALFSFSAMPNAAQRADPPTQNDVIDFPGGAKMEGDGLSTVVVAEKLPVKLTAPSPGLMYQWEAPPGVKLSKQKGKVTEVLSAPPGKLEVSVYYAVLKGKVGENADADEKTWTFKLVVGGVAPQPPPPGPDPKPDPKPDPISASPFAEPGLRVLISFDSTALRSPAEQSVIAPSKAIRDWLNGHCVPDPTGQEKDGKGQVQREWRIWPATENGQPTDVSGARKVWKDAWANKGPEKRDWIMVGDGKKGNGAGEQLPKTEAEVLAILQKIGGP